MPRRSSAKIEQPSRPGGPNSTSRSNTPPARSIRSNRSWNRSKRNWKIKNKILKIQTVAYIEHRIILAKAIIKSATTTIVLFILISILLTFAAYPKLLSTATANFYQGNPAFLNFVVATIKASQSIAEAIPPIGAIATTVQNALIAIAPSFRNALQATASAIADGLVALTPTEKYLIIQNIAAWTVALTALLYSQYVKPRRYRR
jgi:hypothetical protein